MSLEEYTLQLQTVLCRLRDSEAIRLYPLSCELMDACIHELSCRAIRKFGHTVTSPQEYIRLLTRCDEVIEGSERYIPVEDALFRAAMARDRELTYYFMNLIPEPHKRVLIPLVVAASEDDLECFEEFYSRAEESCSNISCISQLLLEANLVNYVIEDGGLGRYLDVRRARINLQEYISPEILLAAEIFDRSIDYSVIESLGSVELARYLLRRFIVSEQLQIQFILDSSREFLEDVMNTASPVIRVTQRILQLLLEKNVSPHVLLRSD